MNKKYPLFDRRRIAGINLALAVHDSKRHGILVRIGKKLYRVKAKSSRRNPRPQAKIKGRKPRRAASVEESILRLYAKSKGLSTKNALDRLIAFEQRMDDKDA
jgi:hypothetical protein